MLDYGPHTVHYKLQTVTPVFSLSWDWLQTPDLLTFLHGRPGTLAPGDLVKFIGQDAATFHFFLGPALNKPMIQVLVEGFPCADGSEFSVLSPTTNLPQICSSQQFFQSFLEKGGPIPVETIPFKLLKYDVLPHRPISSVVLREGAEQKRFELTNQKPKRVRPVGQLPFGLKRPRKRKATGASGRKRKKAPAAAQPETMQVDPEPTAPDAAYDSGSSEESSTSSSSSNPEASATSDSEAEIPFRTETRTGSW